MLYELNPTELAEVTGLSQDSQRDWRRRGFLEDMGQLQPNGRWLYSAADAVVVSIILWLLAKRLTTDINDAKNIAKVARPMVVFWIEPNNPADEWQAHYRRIPYVAAFGANSAGDAMQIETFSDVGNVFSLKLPAALVIDCRLLARDLNLKLAYLVEKNAQRRASLKTKTEGGHDA